MRGKRKGRKAASILLPLLLFLAPGVYGKQEGGPGEKADIVVPISSWLSIRDLTLTEKELPPGWILLEEEVYSQWNKPLHSTVEILAKNLNLTLQEKKIQSFRPGKKAPFNLHFFHLKERNASPIDSFLRDYLKPKNWDHLRMGDIFIVIASPSGSLKARVRLALEESYFHTLEEILSDPAKRPEVHSVLGLQEQAVRNAIELGRRFLEAEEGCAGRAAEYFQKAQKLMGETGALQDCWEILLGLGESLRRRGMLQESETKVREALQAASSLSRQAYAAAQVHLAATLARSGKGEEALELLRKAVPLLSKKSGSGEESLLERLCAREKALDDLVRQDPQLKLFLR